MIDRTRGAERLKSTLDKDAPNVVAVDVISGGKIVRVQNPDGSEHFEWRDATCARTKGKSPPLRRKTTL